MEEEAPPLLPIVKSFFFPVLLLIVTIYQNLSYTNKSITSTQTKFLKLPYLDVFHQKEIVDMTKAP
jgi:hypothetical protein